MAAANGKLRIATAATELLDLQGSGLTQLPPKVAELTNLRTLNLADNRLARLPAEIGQLTNLATLNLAGNQLATLPPEIAKLTCLRTLNLAGNQLATLPVEIGQLTNLAILYVARNQLVTLPSEIAKLTNLVGLHLARNQLATLPAEVGELTNLSTLDLKDNQLTALPPEICQLFRLSELYLRNNRLTMQQLDIGKLTSLYALSVGDNQLTELPPDICRCTRLRELRLSGNSLTTLPTEIGQLTNLTTLDVSGNQLATLPAEIGRLASLQELNLSGNQLATLPAETGKLVRLRKLDLKSNHLIALPSKLADLLLNGLRLELQDNPLNDPLPEFLARGLDSLVTYLRSLDDAIAHYEAKILLVGEGNVGKTSLVAALRDEPFLEKRETTHGIEIHPLIMRHPALRTNMIVRVWDFGGQPIYRITHQFFFSQRAVYLVVWNAREGHEQNDVEGWLRRVRLRVSYDARVLIVATHCDECRPELDYPDLKRIFSELLVGNFEVDNRTRRGISELNAGIAEAVSQLPHMGQMISLRWIAARDEIIAHSETEPQISYRQFSAICKRHYVEDDQIVMLAKMMHNLGQIVYYADDEGLRDFVVLDPEWLTKAISYVLEDEPTRKADGVLEHARLPDIWQNRQGRLAYPARYYPYFLRLMEKFDVSYRLEVNIQVPGLVLR